MYDVWGDENAVQKEEQKRRQMLLNVEKDSGELIIENLGGDLIRVDPNNMTRFQVFFWSDRLMTIWEQGGGTRQLRSDEVVVYGASMMAGALTQPVLRKLGGLSGRANETVADVIRSRGGTAANVREAGPWAQKTLAETAEAAVKGDATAETAIKIAKEAARLGQKH